MNLVKTKMLTTLGLLAVLTACAADRTMEVTFNSDPPGQRVFLGYTTSEKKEYAKEFIGLTPCTNTVICGRSGTVVVQSKVSFKSSWVQPFMIFTCEPSHDATNLFPQKVVLRGEAHFHDADVIPKSIFFDMYKNPVEKPAKP